MHDYRGNPLADDTPSPDKLKKQLDQAAQVYRDRVRTLPGDLFFLNALSEQHRDGYIVDLRRLREIAPASIALRPADVRHAPARRISRLRAPFRYRLTQKLAAVFADIGLPPEYEDQCSSTVISVTTSIISIP